MLKNRFYPLCATLLCALLFSSSLAARPGESRSTLEGRLLQDRKAVKVSSRDIEGRLNHRSVPYRNIFVLFPERLEQEIYYKPAVPGKASSTVLVEGEFPDGWELHVIYINGRSVFEAYRRNGAGISNFEEQGLLSLSKGQSYWKRVENAEQKPSAIGYQYERADGEIRAVRKGGNYLLLYLPDFDEKLFAVQQQLRQVAEEEAKEKAPNSIDGF